MSAEDEQSQSGYEDGLAGGPGAPTPLSALEVCVTRAVARGVNADDYVGYRRFDEARYPAVHGRGLQYSGERSVHAEEDPRDDKRHLGAESHQDPHRR